MALVVGVLLPPETMRSSAMPAGAVTNQTKMRKGIARALITGRFAFNWALALEVNAPPFTGRRLSFDCELSIRFPLRQ